MNGVYKIMGDRRGESLVYSLEEWVERKLAANLLREEKEQ